MRATISVREAAIEDRIALWEWRNDPAKCTVSKTGANVDYAKHKRWFRDLQRSDRVLLCIGLLETVRIGCVRFDEKGPREFGASLFLRPAYCGRGLSGPFLEGAIRFLREQRTVERVSVELQSVNAASGRFLSEAGLSVARNGDKLIGSAEFSGTGRGV